MIETTFKQNYARAEALYVHVPFCHAKCSYCDFYSVCGSPELMRRYVHAIECELKSNSHVLATPLDSVFFGGGTPTCLPPRQLAELLSFVGALITDHTEFTVEANPATIDSATASLLVGAGVNRVSVGVQSFQVDELKILGRIHTAETPALAIGHLRREGIENISIDLIYGIVGQTLATWKQSLHRAIDLGIEHLSCYALTIEPNTPLGREIARGVMAETDDALQRDMYDTAREIAGQCGMEHYEISNFARPGMQCRQNLTYWRNEPYLGVGPAAASYIDSVRKTNHPDLNAYIQAIEAGRSCPCDRECLTGRAQMGETVMVAMRMTQGLDRQAFVARFGQDVLDVFPQSLRRYETLGAVRISPTHVSLSPEVLFLSDTVLADILAEA